MEILFIVSFLVAVAGKVDVLHDNEWRASRDYQEADTVVPGDDASMKSRLYAHKLSAIGTQICSGSIAFLEDANIIPVAVSKEMLTKTEQIAEKILTGIVNREFIPYPPGISARHVIM